MEKQRTSWLPLSVLIVGLAMAWALFNGLQSIADVVHYKSFSSSSSNPDPSPNVVVLPNNRVLIVETRTLSLFRVEPNGKLIFESRTKRDYVKGAGNVFAPDSTQTP